MSDAEEAPKDVIAQFIDQVKDLRRWVVEQASRPNRQRQPGRIIDEFKRIWFALGSKLSILSTLPDHIRMQILERYAKARDSEWDDVNLRDLSRLRSAVTAYVTNYEYHTKKPQFEVEPIPANLVPLGWEEYPEYSWNRGLNPGARPCQPRPPHR
eukprot:tig00021073_g18071.t1